MSPSLINESPVPSPPPAPVDRSRRYTRILLVLFLCTLPLVNAIFHGDGVGYYAYVRAPLIERNFDFTHDYQHAHPSFRDQRLAESRQLKSTLRLAAVGAKFLNAFFGVAYAGCQPIFDPSVGLPWATNE